MKLAIFDIDGTITRKSSERFFIHYLLKQNELSYGRLILTFFIFLLKHPLQARTGFKQNKMYLRGFSDKRLRELASNCFENFIKPDIKTALMNEIQKRKSEGYQILLLSGSLPCLVEPMVRHTGADFMICSDIEIINGRYTGEMKSLHPYGKNKKILAENFCKEHSFVMEQACAYANEWADRFLLDSAGEAIAVDPDEKLEKMADEKEWRIAKNLLKENA